MKRYFCDLCGDPVNPNYHTESYVCMDPILCDKSALVQIKVSTNFVEHSTGYGGPPDLCCRCLCDLIEELKRKIQSAGFNKGSKNV